MLHPDTPNEHLVAAVRDALAEDARLNALDVEVRAVGSTLHLHGEVAGTELIAVAEQIVAELAPHVTVVNRLVVCAAAGAPARERIR